MLEDSRIKPTTIEPERTSLLAKYGIPITHLDYAYVKVCKDGQELEKILKVLQSGEEGHFPDLTRVTEERLSVVKPKSRLLRQTTKVISKEELGEEDKLRLRDEMKNWVKDVEKQSKEFEKGVVNVKVPVRDTKIGPAEKSVEKKTSRIKSTDYASWDKYDPDTEILKIDLEEERLKKEAKKTVTTKSDDFKVSFATAAEAASFAEKQRIIGNEYFKSNDFEEALKCYSHSIEASPTAAAFTNRALCYLKTEKYDKCVEDCEEALKFDKRNVKALLRKAEAEEKLGMHENALTSIDYALKIDPNCSAVQGLARRLAKYRKEITTKTKMQIKDIKSETSNTNEKNTPARNCGSKSREVIPIPGTSKAAPPFIKVVNSSDPETISSAKKKVYNVPHLMHITHIENSSDEEPKIEEAPAKPTRQVSKEKKRSKQINIQPTEDEKRQILLNDRGGGGEPCSKAFVCETLSSEDLNSPFTFLKAWNSVCKDTSYIKHAEIIKNIDTNRIVETIGYKLDSSMLSTILNCMSLHLLELKYANVLHNVLLKLTEIPRFNIVKMFITSKDKEHFNRIVRFLESINSPLEENIQRMYYDD